MKVVVTGSRGFVGKNLLLRLSLIEDIEISCIFHDDKDEEIASKVKGAQKVIHLAGVNRPKTEDEFTKGQKDFAQKVISAFKNEPGKKEFLYTSSKQADYDNVYGQSKKAAEDYLKDVASDELKISIIRPTNIFGKFCRPNYNSVVATFCHNIANGIEIDIHHPENEVELLYVDDLIDYIIDWYVGESNSSYSIESNLGRTYKITLAKLADKIKEIEKSHETLEVPDFMDSFTKKLYATFMHYRAPKRLSYKLTQYSDDRGSLMEFIKSKNFGQVFVSTTKPGITRGNHYHHSKGERFFVVQGKAKVSFRSTYGDEVEDYIVEGGSGEVLEIPAGYTHNITNVGESELLTIFWSNEIFDRDNPDTYFLKVEE